MKIKNILLSGLSAVALVSCSDYLEVDAPSKLTSEYIFSDRLEVERALDGVYASMLNNNTYGQNFLNVFQLNSDVDFGTNGSNRDGSSNFKRFDCDPDGGNILNAWSGLYSGIERANLFIDALENSKLLDDEEYTEDLHSMLGEAKVLRAIFYHDLTWMFGDVPFTLVPSNKRDNSEPIAIVDRTEMLQTLIDDLIECAPAIKTVKDGVTVEHISRDMAHAMIARLAMTAGGYSLRPDGGSLGTMMRPENYTVNGKTYDWTSFYEIAKEYAGKVIEDGNHKLSLPFHQVFVDECNFIVNNNDDVIFEIPFGSEANGRIGYIHGPKADAISDEEGTPHPFGKTNGGATLSALYRFLFEEGDVRRDFVNQIWSYSNQGKTTLKTDRTAWNGKWSKLWNKSGFGATSGDNTGINYPLMRYADVLLMYAEAVNALEDGFGGKNGAKANAAYLEVRTRAFPEASDKVVSLMGKSKEEILKAILDERKFEFAGENMRWRDLVRNNLYNEVVYYTFWRYNQIAEDLSDADTDAVSEYDFGEPGRWDRTMVLPANIYHTLNKDNTGFSLVPERYFPNDKLSVVEIVNPYENIAPSDPRVAGKPYASDANFFSSWYDENNSRPVADVMYSLYGYIHQDERTGIIMINDNGIFIPNSVTPSAKPTYKDLPVLRYILPIPRTVIARSYGAYTNKYGYR